MRISPRVSLLGKIQGIKRYMDQSSIPLPRSTMASFKCADIGMNCGFEVKGSKDANEIMAIAAAHAKSSHGISNPPPDLVAKLQKAIKA